MTDKYHVLQSESVVTCEPKCNWGGTWTEDKLETFSKYVNAYLVIMNKYRYKYDWKLIYFDGFAGSGSKIEEEEKNNSELLLDLFKDESITSDEINVYKGAAERVLSLEQRGFDFYYFIDKDEESSKELQKKLSPFEKEKFLIYRNSDANEQVKMLADALHNNNKYKALIFLDPFGMQVEWNAIAELAKTKTDLWILIPTGVIVNRLLDRKGELKHIGKLTSFFGLDKNEIQDHFYKQKITPTFFGNIEIIEKVDKPIEKIAELYIQRLQTIFDYVTEQPLVMHNCKNNPIFHFAFASNNENAVRIANKIIGKRKKDENN